MKKIIYSITLICLIFVGTINVSAEGNVEVTPTTLEIVEGETGKFNIITNNAMAKANITISDSSKAELVVSAYDQESGSLNTDGVWVAKGEGKGKTYTHPITVKALGKAGDKLTITVTSTDASSYDEESLATPTKPIVKTIDLTIVKKGTQIETLDKNPQTGDTLIYVVLLLTLGALIYSYWYMKKTQEN